MGYHKLRYNTVIILCEHKFYTFFPSHLKWHKKKIPQLSQKVRIYSRPLNSYPQYWNSLAYFDATYNVLFLSQGKEDSAKYVYYIYCYFATGTLCISTAVSIHKPVSKARHSPALNTREKQSLFDCFDQLFQIQLQPKTPNIRVHSLQNFSLHYLRELYTY